jgi:hypothetical protein
MRNGKHGTSNGKHGRSNGKCGRAIGSTVWGMGSTVRAMGSMVGAMESTVGAMGTVSCLKKALVRRGLIISHLYIVLSNFSVLAARFKLRGVVTGAVEFVYSLFSTDISLILVHSEKCTKNIETGHSQFLSKP